MAEIYDAILVYAKPEAEAGLWNDVNNILNSGIIEKRNPESWTVAKLQDTIGQANTVTVLNTLKSEGQTNPILDGAWLAMTSVGVQLYQPNRQAMIDNLAAAGGWGEPLTTTVKELGVTYSTPAEAYGLGVTTPSGCADSWAVYVLEQEWSTLFNSNIVPNTSDRTNLVAALRTVADTLET